jgi:hypothetical protein
VQIDTLEHAPFDHTDNAVLRDLVEQISAFNRACEKLGEAFKMVDGMSEKVSPARKHLAQGRNGVSGS